MSSITKKNPFAKNAVLFKDMSIDIKRPKVLILMLIFNGVIASIASGFMLYMTVAGLSVRPKPASISLRDAPGW